MVAQTVNHVLTHACVVRMLAFVRWIQPATPSGTLSTVVLACWLAFFHSQQDRNFHGGIHGSRSLHRPFSSIGSLATAWFSSAPSRSCSCLSQLVFDGCKICICFGCWNAERESVVGARPLTTGWRSCTVLCPLGHSHAQETRKHGLFVVLLRCRLHRCWMPPNSALFFFHCTSRFPPVRLPSVGRVAIVLRSDARPLLRGFQKRRSVPPTTPRRTRWSSSTCRCLLRRQKKRREHALRAIVRLDVANGPTRRCDLLAFACHPIRRYAQRISSSFMGSSDRSPFPLRASTHVVPLPSPVLPPGRVFLSNPHPVGFEPKLDRGCVGLASLSLHS